MTILFGPQGTFGWFSYTTSRDTIRPRKTLGWKTPAETLNEYLKSVQQSSVATTG